VEALGALPEPAGSGAGPGEGATSR
jgi:hypothetical protein